MDKLVSKMKIPYLQDDNSFSEVLTRVVRQQKMDMADAIFSKLDYSTSSDKNEYWFAIKASYKLDIETIEKYNKPLEISVSNFEVELIPLDEKLKEYGVFEKCPNCGSKNLDMWIDIKCANCNKWL